LDKGEACDPPSADGKGFCSQVCQFTIPSTAADFTLLGDSDFARLGMQVAVVDFNGDGREDLAAVTLDPPSIILIPGPLIADDGMANEASTVAYASEVNVLRMSPGGDINHDGFGDLAVVESMGGGAWFVLGNSTLTPVSLTHEDHLEGGIRIAGPPGDFNYPWRNILEVAVFDIDNDGNEDMIGLVQQDPGGICVLHGPLSADQTYDCGAGDLVLKVKPEPYWPDGECLKMTVTVGPIGTEGLPGIVFGYSGNDLGSPVDAGRIWAFYGGVTGYHEDLDDIAWMTVSGTRYADCLGYRLALADVNADGISEIVSREQAFSTTSTGAFKYPNDGTTLFELSNELELVADIDGNGADDLLTPFNIWFSLPDAQGGVHLVSVPIGPASSVAVGNFDGNEALDLVVAQDRFPSAGYQEGGAVWVFFDVGRKLTEAGLIPTASAN
jgi:hypothetical protein